jgi:Uma2 family endonuclease
MAAHAWQTVSSGIELVRLNATVHDLEHTPDDGYHYELLRGVLFRMPSPKEYHGAICMLLGAALVQYCNTHGMRGQVVDNAGFDFSSPTTGATVLGPDIAVTSSAVTAYGPYRTIPPLLAVEVASPSDSRPYLADRAHLYIAAGVMLVWVVWPDTHTVDIWTTSKTVLTLGMQEILDGETVLPGLAIPIAEIFP